MADHTKIEWTDATWNPITGCTLVSEGCRHCYAARLAATRLRDHPSREGLARINAAGEAKFTGELRFNPQWLDQPLQWKRPRMIFVCAHGDLFHEKAPDEWIDQIFAVMAMSSQHVFQILTKRPERMKSYIGSHHAHLSAAAERIGYRILDRMPDEGVDYPAHWSATASALIHGATPDVPNVMYPRPAMWPLPNVWLGTSVEDQVTTDTRVPYLLDTPAAVRWISAEPLLGPVDLKPREFAEQCIRCGEGPNAPHDHMDGYRTRGLDWVVAGGESGNQARPANPQWFRDLRDQCAKVDIPFLFKQWGEWVSVSEVEGPGEHHTFPDGRTVRRAGKSLAGRLLDGVEHNGFPEVRHG